MFGLGFPQLVLILAGICFMAAGIYGLAPSLVTSRLGSIGGGAMPGEPRLSKKQRKALARAESLRLVEMKPQPQLKPQPQAQTTPQPEPQITQEEAPAMKAEAKIAPVAETTVPVAVAAPIVEKLQPEPAARIEAPAIVLVPQPEPASDLGESVVMDQELVEELFSEMFALRSTVAGLVNEVKQLRTEQKSRRFIVEEVVA